MEPAAVPYSSPTAISGNPQLAQAGQQALTAQQNANTSSLEDLSLPQALLNSLPQETYTNTSPNVQNQAAALTNYQNVLGAAGAASPYITFNGQQVAVSPSTYAGGMTAKEQEAATPLNADNMILALQNQGLTTTISNIAAAHAAQTQQLTDQAQQAQQGYQQVLDKLSLSAQTALSAATLAENEREFQASAPQQALASNQMMQDMAKNTSDFGSFYSQIMSNAAYVSGQGSQLTAAQNAINTWTQLHPGGNIPSAMLSQLNELGVKVPGQGIAESVSGITENVGEAGSLLKQLAPWAATAGGTITDLLGLL